ncbi:hypothetical protein L7F22_028300, partial [Adiantum nelumboides]|nr:hypothetical protein [Adiantum nelumboides]
MYAFRCLLEIVAPNLNGVTGVSPALECGLAYDCPLRGFCAFECDDQSSMVEGLSNDEGGYIEFFDDLLSKAGDYVCLPSSFDIGMLEDVTCEPLDCLLDDEVPIKMVTDILRKYADVFNVQKGLYASL